MDEFQKARERLLISFGALLVVIVWYLWAFSFSFFADVSFWATLPFPVVIYFLMLFVMVRSAGTLRRLHLEEQEVEKGINEKIDDALAQEGKPSPRR